MQPHTTGHDYRLAALMQWVERQLGRAVTPEPISTDAGFRRYFRFRLPERSLVAMDAPPEREPTASFVRVAGLFAEAGLNVPEIVARDADTGFMLLTDLGERSWLEILDDASAGERFPRAIHALLRLQSASRPGVLPAYEETLLRRELALFADWYLQRHLGMAFDGALASAWNRLSDHLVEQALGQGRVWVHRDFMPRNLMDTEPDPGVLDFQDAVEGPVTYDPVCLFKDAFISWPEDRVAGWLEQYWQGARDRDLPVPDSLDAFLRDCDLMGAHRHLKVLGIFARLCYRDGKPKYLEDAPRFLAYLRGAIARRDELAPLREVLAEAGL